MKTPKLTFKIDEELDVEMIKKFLKVGAGGGFDFKQIFIEHYPEIENIEEEDIDKFLAEFYSRNLSKIRQAVDKFEQNWNEVSGRFWTVSNRLFKNKIALKGEYDVFITLNPFSPRFLEDESFMIYFRGESAKGIIAHELMHFFFYQYTQKFFPEIFSELDPDSGIYWDMAEIFNNVVLDSEMFNFITKEEHPYPDHEKYLDAAKAIFDPGNIDKFILGLKGIIENFDESRETDVKKL